MHNNGTTPEQFALGFFFVIAIFFTVESYIRLCCGTNLHTTKDRTYKYGGLLIAPRRVGYC